MLKRFTLFLCLCLTFLGLVLPTPVALADAAPSIGVEQLRAKYNGDITQRGYLFCLYERKKKIATVVTMIYSTQLPITSTGVIRGQALIENIYGRLLLGQYIGSSFLSVGSTKAVDLQKRKDKGFTSGILGLAYLGAWTVKIPSTIPNGAAAIKMYDAQVDDILQFLSRDRRDITDVLDQKNPGVICVPEDDYDQRDKIYEVTSKEDKQANLPGNSLQYTYAFMKSMVKNAGTSQNPDGFWETLGAIAGAILSALFGGRTVNP